MIIESTNTTIHVFDRTLDGERIYYKDTNFKPYFYVENKRMIDDPLVDSTQRGFKTFMGTPVQKVILRHPSALYNLKNQWGKSFESNIGFEQRYLIDKITEIPDVKQRKLFFDIETDDSNGVPNYKNPFQQIFSVAFYDNFEKIYRVYALNNDKPIAEQQKLTINIGEETKTFEYVTQIFDTERELLDGFFKKVNELDPDFLLGWNINGKRNKVTGKFRAGFDLPYLVARSKRIKANANALSYISEVYLSESSYREGKVTIKGRECVELMELYEKHKLKQMAFNLDAVAKRELHSSKKELVGTLKHWKTDLKTLLDYNVVDVILTQLIDEKLELSNQAFQTSRISFSRVEDVGSVLKLIRHSCINECHKQGLVFEEFKDVKKNKFKGGFVGETLPGVHENIVSLDLVSLYPNIIRAFCISPENVSEHGVEIPGNLKFVQNRDALLLKVINNFYEPRIKVKKLMQAETNKQRKKYLKTKSDSLKAVLNSVYGSLKLLFGSDIAESVTLCAQTVIKHSINEVKKENLPIVYIDTDSVSFIAGETLEEAVVKGSEVNVNVNDSYEEFMQGYGLTNKRGSNDVFLKLNFEKVYSRGFWSVKSNGKGAMKRRFCWIGWEDGRFVDSYAEVMGFETKKAGFSVFYKSLQRSLLEMVCPKQSVLPDKKIVDDFLTDKHSEIQSGSVPLQEMVANVNVGKLPKQYFESKNDYTNNNPKRRGVIYGLKHLGLQPEAGKRYELLWVKTVPKPYPEFLELDVQSTTKEGKVVKRKRIDVDVVVYEQSKLPDGFIPNYEKYVELNVVKPAKNIYESLGWDLPSCFITKKKKVSVDKFQTSLLGLFN